jgi:transcriptional regulator with XRE-family HTH domain
MGVEGKDKAKVLEAGAASLSNQLGLAVQRMRKSYGLSLADLSNQSGVAKSIISQIEHNETNPTLTTIWRLAHALDASIESMLRGAEEGPFIEHLKRGTTPIFVSDDGLCRLAVTGWLKTVDWLQWYDFQADPGGVLESTAHARGSVECLSVLEGELEVEVGGSKEIVSEGETLRYRCDMPHRISNRGAKLAHATMVCILKAAAMD